VSLFILSILRYPYIEYTLHEQHNVETETFSIYLLHGAESFLRS